MNDSYEDITAMGDSYITMEHVKRHMMEKIEMHEREVFTSHVSPGATVDTLRVTLDFTVREMIMHRRQDILDYILKQCAGALAHKLGDYINLDPSFDAAMKKAVAQAIKEEATRQVAAQVDEFIKEIIE